MPSGVRKGGSLPGSPGPLPRHRDFAPAARQFLSEDKRALLLKGLLEVNCVRKIALPVVIAASQHLERIVIEASEHVQSMLFIPLPMRGVARTRTLAPSLQPCCNTVISKWSPQFGSDVISISAAREPIPPPSTRTRFFDISPPDADSIEKLIEHRANVTRLLAEFIEVEAWCRWPITAPVKTSRRGPPREPLAGNRDLNRAASRWSHIATGAIQPACFLSLTLRAGCRRPMPIPTARAMLPISSGFRVRRIRPDSRFRRFEWTPITSPHTCSACR